MAEPYIIEALTRSCEEYRARLATLATEIEGLAIRCRCSFADRCTCEAGWLGEKVARLVKLARGER